MAIVLHRHYSGQIVGIFDDVWDTVPRHVGVYLPSGKYADARGLEMSEKQFLDGFRTNSTKIEKMTENQVKYIWRNRNTNWDIRDEDLLTLGLIADDK